MTADFDVSSNGWGHAIYGARQNDDGSWVVSGCLTPLPNAGQTALLRGGAVWRFRSVDPMGNPSDGFHAVMEPAAIEEQK